MKALRAIVAGIGVFAALQFTPAGAAEPIRIGSFLSVSGQAAFLGDPEKKVLELYVGRINKAGGVDGRQIELTVYDDDADAAKATSFVKRLIESDKVDIIIGGTVTATTMAAAPIVQRAGVPFISLAGAVEIIDPVQKWMFKTPHTDRMAAEKIMADLKAHHLTRLALLSDDSGFGKSGRKQTLIAAKASGVEIVADEVYGARDTDVTPQLTKIRGVQSAQALLVFGFGQGCAVATRNVRQLGINLPLYQSHGVASREFIRLAGDGAEGVRMPAAGLVVADELPASDPQKKVVTDFSNLYLKTFGTEPSTFAGHAYDALMITIDAIRRAKTTDHAALRDAIEATHGYVGTGGIVNMSATDHMGLSLSAFHMVEIRNGDFKLAE